MRPLKLVAWAALTAWLLCLPALGQDLGTQRQRLHDAMREERWREALSAALEIVELRPTDPTAHYNTACVLARMGEPRAAVEALGQAARLGFSAVETMRVDPDLESVRADPGYAAALKRVEETRAREIAAIKERAATVVPLLFPPPGEAPDSKGQASGQGYPLVVLLHGRGGRAENMARFWRPAAEKIGAVLVVPEAFAAYGNGFQWGPANEAFDRVTQAIEFAAERHPIDRRRVIVAGFSQGAQVALFSAARDPGRFAGVVAIGSCNARGYGLAEPRVENPPPIYIGIGSEDGSYDDCRPMAEVYEAAGFEVKVRVYRGYGHIFPENYTWEFTRAFRFVLRQPPDSAGTTGGAPRASVVETSAAFGGPESAQGSVMLYFGYGTLGARIVSCDSKWFATPVCKVPSKSSSHENEDLSVSFESDSDAFGDSPVSGESDSDGTERSPGPRQVGLGRDRGFSRYQANPTRTILGILPYRASPTGTILGILPISGKSDWDDTGNSPNIRQVRLGRDWRFPSCHQDYLA